MSRSLHMTSHGMYGVLLHNRENCTDPEIKSLISQFGKIREYHRVSKPVADLIFVHFQEYEEARACLERLERDPMFYAMPARPREGRVAKPVTDRENNARSLSRGNDDRKSILRSKSSLAKLASQRDSSSSSDECNRAKGTQKEVRFVRPGDTPTPPRRRRSRSECELSMLEDLSRDRPPHLVNLLDVWTEQFVEESGVLTSTELIVCNLPIHFTDAGIYAICDQFVHVLSVEVFHQQFDNLPYVFAVVQLRSPQDAKMLKKLLHRKQLKGKVLHVIFSSDFY